MEVAKLGLIFCIIVVIIWLKYPLYLAMTAGILSAILLFQIPVTEALLLLGRQTIAWETIDLLLPISLPLSFFLLFFFGTIIGGSQAVVALCMPIAMTAIPDEGLPFLAMLMGAAWAAMELSPTHVCAFVAEDYYHTTFADLVAKALPSGAGFYVNRLAAECDLLVTKGFIEPHFFAGFSGGRKSILPGICAEKTVNENHSFKAISSPWAKTGVLEHNPIHEDMIAAARRVNVQFILNVALGEKKNVVAAFAGVICTPHTGHPVLGVFTTKIFIIFVRLICLFVSSRQKCLAGPCSCKLGHDS